MLCSAPVATTELSGQPSHVFAVRRAKYDSGSGMNGIGSCASRNQAIWNVSDGMENAPPSVVNTWLIAPSSWSNMFRQTVATMIGGMTTGRM